MKIDLAGLADRADGSSGACRATTVRCRRRRSACAGSTPPTKRASTSPLQCLDIANKGDEPDTVMSDVQGFEISADRKKMLVAKKEQFFIFDARREEP